MDKAYDIYDNETGNLVGSFSTEEDALAAIHQEINESGSTYIRKAWALLASDLSSKAISGDELVGRASKVAIQF